MDHNNSLNSNIATKHLEANEENVLLSDCPEEEAYTSQKRFTRTTLYLSSGDGNLLAREQRHYLDCPQESSNEEFDTFLDREHGNSRSSDNNLSHAL